MRDVSQVFSDATPERGDKPLYIVLSLAEKMKYDREDKRGEQRGNNPTGH